MLHYGSYIQACFADLEIADLDYCYWLGAQVGKNRSRPILVKLMQEEDRREVLKNRKLLSNTRDYSKVFINEDLPQVVNDRKANIRSVHQNAISKGQNSKMAGTRITVNNIMYRHDHLEKLPHGLRLSNAKMVAVPGGLAFSSEYAYLSNFYPCKIVIKGHNFDSAYQYSRAKHLNDPGTADDIYHVKSAKKCKKIARDTKSTQKWDREKSYHEVDSSREI